MTSSNSQTLRLVALILAFGIATLVPPFVIILNFGQSFTAMTKYVLVISAILSFIVGSAGVYYVMHHTQRAIPANVSSYACFICGLALVAAGSFLSALNISTLFFLFLVPIGFGLVVISYYYPEGKRAEGKRGRG